MARLAFFVCLALFSSTSSLLAQKSEEPWLSLSRLTLTASSSYHYAPWKKYNESLLLVQDAVRYNPAYANPSGSLEQIKGDLTYQLEASYRVLSSFSITVNAGWMQTEGVIDFHNPFPGTASGVGEFYAQTMWLSSYHCGAGVAYTHIVNNILSISAGASIVHYPANLDFQATYQRPTAANLFSANLKESALGLHAHLEAQLSAFGPLSIVSRVEYRWLMLRNLRGSGSETDIEEYTFGTLMNGPTVFDAQLGEAGGYFGLFIPTSQPINDHLLHGLWARTPAGPWWETQKPTSLDLSGFGISLGVSYAF